VSSFFVDSQCSDYKIISQGSVATQLRCGGVSSKHFITNFECDAMVDMTLIRPLKMIGKGFVLFQINNSPSAFYTIKAICIIVIGFKVAIIFKKIV